MSELKPERSPEDDIRRQFGKPTEIDPFIKEIRTLTEAVKSQTETLEVAINGRHDTSIYELVYWQFSGATGELHRFANAVEDRLRDGWTLQGGPFVAGEHICQAVLKRRGQWAATPATPIGSSTW